MSLDLRTRADGAFPPLTAGAFFRETLPPLLDAHQALIAPGASQLRLRDLCIETDGEPYMLGWRSDRAEVRAGGHDGPRLRLGAAQLADLVHDQSTPIALFSTKRLDMPKGGLPDALNWWLVLRAALDGRRIHARGDVTVATPPRSFRPDSPQEEMRAFLEEAGYLHIEGLFSAEEMAAVEADYPKAAPHFAKGDPKAWFATTKDGAEHLVRMEGFDRYSRVTAELLESERFLRIARIPRLSHAPRPPGARAGALWKPIGVVSGISDVPWHKDCSLGRHSYECCSLTVGISVTGADARSGQLRVVPGSHRALVWPAPCLQPGLDLVPRDLPTRTGDATVHLSCTLHMSQPPVERTRKVVYTGFAQPPQDAEAANAARQRIHELRGRTHTSVSQEPGYLGD